MGGLSAGAYHQRHRERRLVEEKLGNSVAVSSGGGSALYPAVAASISPCIGESGFNWHVAAGGEEWGGDPPESRSSAHTRGSSTRLALEACLTRQATGLDVVYWALVLSTCELCPDRRG
eukprot:6214632-Pleurochrysis_carterae.AAC.5